MKKYTITEKSKKKYLEELEEESIEYLASLVEETTEYSKEICSETFEETYQKLLDVPAKFVFQADEYWEDEIKEEELLDQMLKKGIMKTKFEDTTELKMGGSKTNVLKALSELDKPYLILLAESWNEKHSKSKKVLEKGFKAEIVKNFGKQSVKELQEFIFDENSAMFFCPLELEDCQKLEEVLVYVMQLPNDDQSKIAKKLRVMGIKLPKKSRDEEWGDVFVASRKAFTFSKLFEVVKTVDVS